MTAQRNPGITRPCNGTADEKARPGFGRIDFEGLCNTRDLGGLMGADGRRVRRGLLLRSGTLYFATPADLDRLRNGYRLRLVVDLRGIEELAELPDPTNKLPQARYLHVDVLREALGGVSQDARSREAFERLEREALRDPSVFMERLYPHILLDDSGITSYRTFMRAILELEGGCALWHCHVGRDRCGMASMLVEHVLGVDAPTIEDDYLATNLFASEPAEANTRFIRAALSAVEREFGGLDGYVREALGLGDADIAELRARYLE